MYDVNYQNTKNSPMHFHPNIIDILFQQKSDVLRKLNDLRGLYFINHIALILINPNQEVVIFSTTPSVEFNLIIQNLWYADNSFNPDCYKEQQLLFWDESYSKNFYEKIKYIKQVQHNFTLGLNILRKAKDFNFIYSFATRNNNSSKEYYSNLSAELLALGDYGYKKIYSIYQQYNDIPLPMIEEKFIRRHLKLIINNT